MQTVRKSQQFLFFVMIVSASLCNAAEHHDAGHQIEQGHSRVRGAWDWIRPLKPLAVTAVLSLMYAIPAAATQMSDILAMKGEHPCLCASNSCCLDSFVCTGQVDCCEQLFPGTSECSVVSLGQFQSSVGGWEGE